MEKTKITFVGLVALVTFLWLLPSVGNADPHKLTCGKEKTIGEALEELKPGDTLLVSGTCNENLVIRAEVHRITLDGQGTATINGPDATTATVSIGGTGITVARFMITGGEDGISVSGGGVAVISGNTIQNSARDGIVVNRNSEARVTNSTIQNNARNGITAAASSSLRVGLLSLEGIDTVPGGVAPVTIQNNGGRGVSVSRASSALIVNNTIRGNGDDGIAVTRVSNATISSNVINSNGGDGIFVSSNSGVNLGEDTGTNLDELPNNTTVNNTGFGIRCVINSYADGRQGTLNGASGATSFGGSCVNSLIP